MPSGNLSTRVDVLPPIVPPSRQDSLDTTTHGDDQPVCVTAVASTVHFGPGDMEAGPEPIAPPATVDIEHAAVNDDPRQWSSRRKVRILVNSVVI